MEISFEFQECDEKIRDRLSDKELEVKEIIEDSFINHPFAKNLFPRAFLPDFKLPPVLKVKICFWGSEIDREGYPKEIVLFLNVDNYWGYVEGLIEYLKRQWTDEVDKPSIWTKPFSLKGLRSVLYHEFAHVYDAIFDKGFGYDKSFDRKDKNPEEKELKSYFTNLWNYYIDGRLSNRAPLNYCGRIPDSRPEIRVYQKRAYLREFKTFKSLLQAASEVQILLKKRVKPMPPLKDLEPYLKFLSIS